MAQGAQKPRIIDDGEDKTHSYSGEDDPTKEFKVVTGEYEVTGQRVDETDSGDTATEPAATIEKKDPFLQAMEMTSDYRRLYEINLAELIPVLQGIKIRYGGLETLKIRLQALVQDKRKLIEGKLQKIRPVKDLLRDIAEDRLESIRQDREIIRPVIECLPKPNNTEEIKAQIDLLEAEIKRLGYFLAQ